MADFVVSLANGHIVSQGSVSDALKKNEKLAEEFKHDEEALELEENEEAEAEASSSADPSTPAKADGGKLVVAEEIADGQVSWQACESSCCLCRRRAEGTVMCTVKMFLTGMGGNWPFFFWLQYFVGAGGSELFGVLEMWWLGYWARQYASRDSNDVNVG